MPTVKKTVKQKAHSLSVPDITWRGGRRLDPQGRSNGAFLREHLIAWVAEQVSKIPQETASRNGQPVDKPRRRVGIPVKRAAKYRYTHHWTLSQHKVHGIKDRSDPSVVYLQLFESDGRELYRLDYWPGLIAACVVQYEVDGTPYYLLDVEPLLRRKDGRLRPCS